MEKRYENPTINRQFWLADALIRVRSYEWELVDLVAASLLDADIDAFSRVIDALNTARETK